MTATEQAVCYSSQEAGHATPDRALSHHVGPHRKAPGSVRRQREQESMGQSHYWNFHRKEWADGIGQYEQFHRTWSVALPLGAWYQAMDDIRARI